MVLAPGAVLHRRFDVVIADGRLSEAQTTALAGPPRPALRLAVEKLEHADRARYLS